MTPTIALCRITVLIFFFGLNVAAQKSDEVEKRRPDASAPRAQVMEWRSAENKPYWYRLPEKGKESKNLLIMLHGTGVPQGWAFWNYPIASGQFRPGDIVVAPEGMTPGNGTSFNFIQNDTDGDQIAGIIRSFKKEFEIERVHLYGHSQGAFFTYWFAGRHPELVDGIVAHAGNLLGNVSHTALAKSKVAIAILHGRADAVVPVECAIQSEKVLRELGYEKLKLEIVEGLTAQSGHWPLPDSVARLLAWLDQVGVADAATAVTVFEQALAAAEPQMSDLITFSERATTLFAKYRGEDRKELEARLEQAQSDFDAALDRVVTAIGALDAKAKSDSPAAALFRLAGTGIADRPAAKKALRACFAGARAESKEIDKAIEVVAKKRDAANLVAAGKILDRRFLAPERIELARLVQRILEQAPEGLKDEQREALSASIQAIISLESEQTSQLSRLLARPDPAR